MRQRQIAQHRPARSQDQHGLGFGSCYHRDGGWLEGKPSNTSRPGKDGIGSCGAK
jgi:hypothetical protein